jgi:hypothetical protein
MLVLLTVILTLTFQGDSERLNRIIMDRMHMTDNPENTLFYSTNTENNTIDNCKSVLLSDETHITDSKSWIINKVSILGY